MPKQDVAFEVFYDGAWHDIVTDDDVFTDSPIVVRHGQGDESPAPRPSQITAQLNNDDDAYRITNPMSPLYGLAARNTPTRTAVGGNVRGVVEASSWACDHTSDFRRSPPRGKAWTDFEGGGLLQRINQWTQPLKSAFRQFNEGLSHITSYFPLEQKGTTSVPEPTFPGPQGFAFSGGVAFDSQTHPVSSGPLMDVNERGGINLYTNVPVSATDTAGWQVSWAQRLEPLTSADTFMLSWNTSGGGGSGDAFQITLLPGTNEIQLQGSNDNVAPGFWLDVTAVIANGGYDFTQWTLWLVDAEYSGGTTTLTVSWVNVDNTVSHTFGGTFAHEPGSFDSWAVSASTDFGEIPEGSTFGHVMTADVDRSGGVDLFSTARVYAWTGYLHERASYRFGRLCDLLGIPYYVSDSFDETIRMGPQPVATLAEHFVEIATTEDALMFDYRNEARLYFFSRYDRYNQTPALQLAPTDLPRLPREVTDDLGIHNLVTAQDRGGIEATAEDSTGPLGTQPPPDGVGEYRQKVEVSLAAPARWIPEIANWWMRRGTVNLPRFPQVTVDLGALDRALIEDVESVEVGSVITIVGFREDTIRLYVLGYVEVVGSHSRAITFTCAPDQQFDVARYDNASKRYDSRTTVVNAAKTTTATSWTVRFPNLGDQWTTKSASLPFDIVVGGERIRVTAVGAVAGAPGAYLQVFTVTRSINGVVKEHPADAPVHMHPEQQARYAL